MAHSWPSHKIYKSRQSLFSSMSAQRQTAPAHAQLTRISIHKETFLSTLFTTRNAYKEG